MAIDEKVRDRENRIPEERELLEVASYYSTLSERDILVIGGTLALPELSGYKRLRLRSRDVDFVVNDRGLETILADGPIKRQTDFPEIIQEDPPEGEEGSYIAERNGLYATFYHNDVKGSRIPEKEFSEAILKKTSEGQVYVISNELNLTFKMLRGIQKKGYILGKDAQDAVSMIVGSHLSGPEFNAEKFRDYLIDQTRAEIDSDGLLGYVSELADETTLDHLKKQEWDEKQDRTIYPGKLYLDKIRECEDYLRKRSRE